MQVDLSFTEPRFLDRNLSAGFDLFQKEVDLSEVSGVQQPVPSGGALRLGFPLSENLWLTNSYTLSNGEIYDVMDVSARERSGKSEGDAIDLRRAALSLTYDDAQPSQEPDQRLLLPGRRRLRGPWRRRAVRAATRRGALLLPDHRRRSPSSAAPSAATSGAGVATTCA